MTRRHRVLSVINSAPGPLLTLGEPWHVAQSSHHLSCRGQMVFKINYLSTWQVTTPGKSYKIVSQHHKIVLLTFSQMQYNLKDPKHRNVGSLMLLWGSIEQARGVLCNTPYDWILVCLMPCSVRGHEHARAF